MEATSDRARAVRELFARNVRLLRRERRMTQEALADATGLWQAHVSEIERGQRNVSIDNIGAVAHALGVGVGRLFQE